MHHDYSVVLSSNDLYVTYSCVCEQVGIAILPYFLAAKNLDLLPINPIGRTVLTADEIQTAESDYITNSEPQDNSEPRENQDSADLNTKGLRVNTTAIPLIQSKPLYMVMHPDVRRSARVSVVAEWLGQVMRGQ